MKVSMYIHLPNGAEVTRSNTIQIPPIIEADI